jgi:hypothetical protein
LANLKLEKMAAFGKLKRGSVQVQRAAIKASGKLDTLISISMLRKLFTFIEKSTTFILENSGIRHCLVEKHSTFTFYFLLPDIYMTSINWGQAG